MSTQGGPNIVTDGLVLALDAANQKFIIIKKKNRTGYAQN